MISPAQTENLASLAHLDLEQEILRLKREMKAVILAHYYQESEIQDLADFVRDSLQLSQQAAATPADVIVFAGVLFTADGEMVAWKESGQGKFGPGGAINYRGILYFQTASQDRPDSLCSSYARVRCARIQSFYD
jgi:hypothetical protein